MSVANGVLPSKAVRQAAARAFKAGISIVPPAEDGTKRPDARWKQYQERLPSREEMRAWYGDRHGLGFVCGAVSGGLELFEFDDRATYEAFKAAAEAGGLGDLVERIEAGYLEETPGDGIHWFYRTDEVRGNTKLAERPDPADPNKRQPLIETRGEGGYVVVAPSGGPVHPSGNPYVLLRGGAGSIVTISGEERDQLWGLARTFDEMPPDDAGRREQSIPVRGLEGRQDGTIHPGDDYAARTSWADILPAGWHHVHTHGETELWRRPDKAQGWSATINHGGSDCLYVFSTLDRPSSR